MSGMPISSAAQRARDIFMAFCFVGLFIAMAVVSFFAGWMAHG